ncbi:efflux RND transporter permease subunit [Timonella senegalensis]|uniref:efflux RND transporter permease subunit n=1 Tax=Timonella senegalensis TaxID=1465825 RepID=UPI0002E1395D|nr:efflux RND transporter permease subunit [Timonella senegalensis]
MSKLANLSLANRAAIALFTIIIALGGLLSMSKLKQELIPSISLPIASVVTALPGGSPEVIDAQVSAPLAKALENVDGVTEVATTSATNLSSISLTTEYGINQSTLRADLKAAIDTVTTLPESATTPNIFFGSSTDLPVLALTVTADEDIAALTSTLNTVVVPEISRIDGVRDVTAQGGLTQRIVITPDQTLLAGANATSQDIKDALEANGTAFPAGTVTSVDGALAVQTGSLITSVKDIESLPLIVEGTSTATIGDVATVKLKDEDPTSITRTNGEPSLSVSVTATKDADIVALSQAIQDALPGIATKAGAGTEFTVVFDQAPFIADSIKHLAIEGVLGLFFAVLVILVFLLSVRSTLVTALSIPLSILMAFIGLYVSGYSLNLLTLSALTITIGRVVDDSIVVIENIKRHLSYGTPKKEAILTGVREVAGAITASTLTTIMVFVPIIIVGGMVGELFRPFGLTVAIAMLSSLLVSLTIVPVLAYWFLPEQKGVLDREQIEAEAQAKEQKSWLQRTYVPVLRQTQKHPVITVATAVALLAGTVALATQLKTDFLGDTGQDTISVTQDFSSGESLANISKVAAETEQVIADTDGVKTSLFTVSTGANSMAMLMGTGTTQATFQITTEDDADSAEVVATLEQELAKLEAADTIKVGAEAMGMSGSTIDIRVDSAEDPKALAPAADAVAEKVSSLKYSGDVENDRSTVEPHVEVTVNREMAAMYGLSEIQVSGIVASLLSPQATGSIRMDNIDTKIYIDNGVTIKTLNQLKSTQLPLGFTSLPLTDVASIDIVKSPTTVRRVQGKYSATISVTPAAGELSKATAEITDALDGLDLPKGVTTTIGGVSQQQSEAFSQLGLAMLIAILIVYALMVATFRSLVQPLILLVSIPFAAIGAIVALLITGTPLGVAPLIGALMLIGIVVTNAIVLIDLINQYREQGMNVPDAIFHGARQRLRPILMTAAATIFALMPMALGVTGGTGFISKDLAIVVIGGLFSSTLLTLVLVPVLYELIEGSREQRRTRKAEEREAARLAERANLGLDTESAS